MKPFKSIAKAFILSTIVMIVVVMLNSVNGYKMEFGREMLVRFLYIMLYTCALYLVNWGIFGLLDSYFKKERFSVNRIFLGFGLSFVMSLLTVFALRAFEEIVVSRRSFSDFISDENPGNYVFAVVVTFIISMSVYLFHFYRSYQENKVREQQIIAGTASAKFETLKNQIDPHFLFNSLNVLSALIEENPHRAQKFTSSLSKIYRYVLEQKDKELVDVAEELSFAKTYVSLLQMRFEDGIIFELPDIIPNSEAKVVSLSLQLLLENTVKHNIISDSRPLRIRIYFEGDYLVVQNDLRKREVIRDSRGVGLQNIVSRYAIISRRKVIVSEDGGNFTVKIPMLTRQVMFAENRHSKEEDLYLAAEKRVEAIKGFYGDLFSYLIFMIALGIINYITSPSYFWFLFPAAGWGVGVVIHGISVFSTAPFLGRQWEERKIKEMMEKEKLSKWS